MDELIEEIYELIGAPPRGQELLAAVSVSLLKSETHPDFDDVMANFTNSVVAALTRTRYGSSAPSSATRAGFNIRLAHSQQETIDAAHEQLGISHHMIWALHPRRLFVFKRSLVGARPKQLTGRHSYRDIELLDVGHPAGGNDKTLAVTIHGLPIAVAVDEDEIVAFATALQRQLRARPRPTSDAAPETGLPAPAPRTC